MVILGLVITGLILFALWYVDPVWFPKIEIKSKNEYIFTAEEANKSTNRKIEKQIAKAKKEILSTLKKESARGNRKYQQAFGHRETRDAMIPFLKELGYNCREYNSQFDYPCIEIKW